MKKIPTLFERVFDNHHKVGINNKVHPGMEWVLGGEGTATEKIDGSCCTVIGGVFYKRYDGMPKMRFHDLRHSCASLLLANGVPLKQIQEWLGHSDFSTTVNIYAHLDYRSKISSAQAMEQGILLPRSDDFGSRWEDVTEQGKITGPDSNPVFD